MLDPTGRSDRFCFWNRTSLAPFRPTTTTQRTSNNDNNTTQHVLYLARDGSNSFILAAVFLVRGLLVVDAIHVVGGTVSFFAVNRNMMIINHRNSAALHLVVNSSLSPVGGRYEEVTDQALVVLSRSFDGPLRIRSSTSFFFRRLTCEARRGNAREVWSCRNCSSSGRIPM
jgi:hypothetical protein